VFMPFADLHGRGIADVLQSMAVPLGAVVLFGFLLLLRPGVFTPLIRLVPIARLRHFLDSAIHSATAYSSRRSALVIALLCAVFGQLTTMAMYFGNAMALQVEGVAMLQVFSAAAVMTLFTFIIPTAAGEGVREFMFVDLLGGRIPTAKAFLIGHVGLWIEKLLLSFQGGVFLLWAPKAYQRVTREDLERLKEETPREQGARARAAGPATRPCPPRVDPRPADAMMLSMRRLVLVLAAILVGAACYWRFGGSDRSQGPQYVAVAVDRGPITATVTATGTVNPVETVQVGTYVSGPIQSLGADFNTPVKKGQLLATIDPRPFTLKVAAAEAELANARANLAKAGAGPELKA